MLISCFAWVFCLGPGWAWFLWAGSWRQGVSSYRISKPRSISCWLEEVVHKAQHIIYNSVCHTSEFQDQREAMLYYDKGASLHNLMGFSEHQTKCNIKHYKGGTVNAFFKICFHIDVITIDYTFLLLMSSIVYPWLSYSTRTVVLMHSVGYKLLQES